MFKFTLTEETEPNLIFEEGNIFMEILVTDAANRAQLEAALPIIEASMADYLPISVELRHIKIVSSASMEFNLDHDEDQIVLMVILNEIDCDEAQYYADKIRFLAVGVLNALQAAKQ